MITDKQTIKPQFAWHKIDSELRIKNSQPYRKISLKPNLLIALENQQKSSLQTRIHIDIEKSLQYQEQIGWNWHKSSNLPVFSLKLTVFDSMTSKVLIPPKLQAKIYAVKIVQNTLEKDHNLYLDDIGIKGENLIELNEGCGSFNGLRFTSTSYNNEGVKFHLLIVIFKSENDNQVPEDILCSVISPPIFVDSRKSARNYQEKKYLSFVEMFNPNDLEKLFAKRESKEDIEEKRIISNSDEGLYNYLTAPNIRHKVKHPLFLCVKFSNAFKIFVNTKSQYFSSKELMLSNVISRLQKKLIKQVGVMRKKKQSQVLDEKEFVIVMYFDEMESEKEKITEMLEYLDCSSIGVLEKGQLMGRQFVDISSLGDIIAVYRTEYFGLKRKSEKEINARKASQSRKQEEQSCLAKENESMLKPKTLFDRIREKSCEEEFSASPQQQDNGRLMTGRQLVEDIHGPNQIVCGQNIVIDNRNGFKRIKPNQTQLYTPNQFYFNHNPSFPQNISYPQFSNTNNSLVINGENYQQFRLNFGDFSPNSGGVKKQQQSYTVYISEKQVVKKIQEMCIQVYQRNKKSILNYLETLKKSNVKWRVKDVEQFIFSYSSALMNEIFFREKLLHHMLLENEILKAKVGMMQQMAVADLQMIKKNIMAMNRFLPEKFITDKLRQNQLWVDDLPVENQPVQASQTRPIEAGVRQIKVQQESQPLQKDNKNEKMIEQVSSSESNQQSFNYECKFVSNVFEMDSPSIKE